MINGEYTYLGSASPGRTYLYSMVGPIYIVICFPFNINLQLCHYTFNCRYNVLVSCAGGPIVLSWLGERHHFHPVNCWLKALITANDGYSYLLCDYTGYKRGEIYTKAIELASWSW